MVHWLNNKKTNKQWLGHIPRVQTLSCKQKIQVTILLQYKHVKFTIWYNLLHIEDMIMRNITLAHPLHIAWIFHLKKKRHVKQHENVKWFIKLKYLHHLYLGSPCWVSRNCELCMRRRLACSSCVNVMHCELVIMHSLGYDVSGRHL